MEVVEDGNINQELRSRRLRRRQGMSKFDRSKVGSVPGSEQVYSGGRRKQLHRLCYSDNLRSLGGKKEDGIVVETRLSRLDDHPEEEVQERRPLVKVFNLPYTEYIVI